MRGCGASELPTSVILRLANSVTVPEKLVTVTTADYPQRCMIAREKLLMSGDRNQFSHHRAGKSQTVWVFELVAFHAPCVLGKKPKVNEYRLCSDSR